MTYGELVNDLRYLAKVYSICENENMREYSLSIAAADAIENLDDICQHQADEIRELKNQWIPVSERLPKYGTKVLVFAYGHDVLTARLCKETEFDYPVFECNGIYNELAKQGRITHWMPLPEPPKDDEA